MRHLLDTKTLGRDGRAPHPRRRGRHGRHAAARGQEAADAARQDRGQPLLRGLHPHPHLVRGRREAPQRRRDQLLGEGLERLEGRVAAGHRADAAGDGGGCRRHPPWRVRRSSHPGDERMDHRRRRQRRRRHARAPHPGAAGRLHDPQAHLRRRQPRARPHRTVGDDRRRHPALSRRALERVAARHPRRRRHARRAADAGSERRLGVAGAGELRPRRGDRRRAGRTHDAADPAGAHGRGVFPH